MTCNSFYTFAAESSQTVDTTVGVNITWNGDLGGYISGTVNIGNGSTCGSTDFFSFNIDCGGEFYSSASWNFTPANSGTQNYLTGTATAGGTLPC